jgi:MFS family permease
MAVALPVFFISPLAGWLCDRFGPKLPAVGGLLFSVPFLILLRLPHASSDDQTGQVALLCAILALLGALPGSDISDIRHDTDICHPAFDERNCSDCGRTRRRLWPSIWIIQCRFQWWIPGRSVVGRICHGAGRLGGHGGQSGWTCWC